MTLRSPSESGESRQDSQSVVAGSNNIQVFCYQEHRHYGPGSLSNHQGIPSTLDSPTLQQRLAGLTGEEVMQKVLGTNLDDIIGGPIKDTEIEEIIEGPSIPVQSPPGATTDSPTVQAHARTTSRTIRVVDARSAKAAKATGIPGSSVRNDNPCGRSVNSSRASARSSRVSKDKAGKPLRRLETNDLRFSQSVQKHVSTYMISEKRKFEHRRHVICLWHPFLNLDLSSDMQEKHCILGDVGVFNADGGFDVMLNIFMTAEENRQMDYVTPPEFTPFTWHQKVWSLDVGEESKFFLTQDLDRRRSDQRAPEGTYTFQSVAVNNDPKYSGSAILVVPNGCTATRLRPNMFSSITDYVVDNVESWYDLGKQPNGHYRDLLTKGSKLYLISASYKSKVWAGAAVHRSSINKGVRLHATLSRNPRSQLEDYEWDVHRSFEVTHGSSKPNVPRNIEYTVAVEVCALDRPNRSLLDWFGSKASRIVSSVFSR